MMDIVGERVAAGESDAEIVAYFRDRYGEWIVLDPPFRLIVTRPGMTLGAPGAASILPTVPTCLPGTLRTTRFTASTKRAPASSASCRMSIGVVPA